MAEKVTFDGVNHLIIVNDGVVSLDAESDLYSAAKREWKDDPTLNKLKLPLRTIAGDPLPGGKFYGAAFFLQNQAGWRIRPHEADHELIIIGNLYPEDEFLPMIVPTLGEYTVTISLERSSLTQMPDLPDLSGLVDEVWNKESRGLKIDEVYVETGKLPEDPASQSALESHITDEVDELQETSAHEQTLEEMKGTLETIVGMVDELEPGLIRSSPLSIAQQLEREKRV